MWFNIELILPVWGMITLILIGMLFAALLVFLLRSLASRDEYDDDFAPPYIAPLSPTSTQARQSESKQNPRSALGTVSLANVAAPKVDYPFTLYEYYLRDGRGPFTLREAQTTLGIPVEKHKKRFVNLSVANQAQIVRKEKAVRA